MEEKVGPFTFISNFDSGNLARVERVKTEDASSSPEDCDGAVVINPDFDYNVWTAPDCAGTEFENQNRTWFYFGIKGGQPGKLLRINILNLNRQGKLYGQGMTPLVKVVPSRNKWERIRDKPKYETVDGQFRLSFTYRFPDQRSGVHYFAFCYPYSYSDCQAKLDDLDRSFTICQQMTPSEPKDSIYFYRELLCYTLDSLRVDLLTITSAKGMMEEREESLPSLFPDKTVPRAHKFEGKKVFFLSARVHPGETPSSFVFNGFLDFILRQDDPRAAALRDQYVFKLIPMLNPDGVKRGHYRTDQRGVNLNRVYMDPDPLLHPSIFAAKSIILYHHTIGNLHQDSDHHNACVCDTEKAKKVTVNLNTTPVETGSEFFTNKDILDLQSVPSELKPELPEPESVKMDFISVEGNGMIDKDANNNKNKETLSSNLDSLALKMSPDVQTGASNDALQMDTVVSNQLSNESTSSMSSDCHSEKQLNTRTLDQPQFKTVLNKKEPANCIYCSSQTSSEQSSGVAYYVDLHGHASKRGCFVYANYLENEDSYVSSILFPKLISLNSTNFDFAACNFTEKNMYSKDKRDGMSKEGSGRVAIYKATGIIHSYTLECNYNCGRTVNCLPPATCDNGCATPPPLPGFPPKYTPEIYEEVGRAMAVAVLDMNNTNPWTRLPLSEFTSLEGVKNWVRRFVKSSKNAPSVPKKLSRVITKTSSMVAGATASTRQKLSVLASSSSDMSSDNAASGGHRTTDHPSQNGTNVNKETGKKPATDTVRRPYHLASTQKTSLQGPGAQSGKSGKNHHDDTCSSSPGTLSGANRRDQLSGPGPLRATVFKAKEQPRVSLELPKTGPTLRLVHNLCHQPQGHVQPTSLSSKSLSSPVEIKMSTIDVHKQFISFHRSKPGVALRNGHSSQSDEEKKKKNVRPRRKNGRKKEKNGEAVARDEIQPSEISSSRPPAAEDIHVSTVEKEEEGKSKSTQLSRRNSSKNMISCSMMSCEVVDIKELPHTPQSGSSTNPLTFWPNTSVS